MSIQMLNIDFVLCLSGIIYQDKFLTFYEIVFWTRKVSGGKCSFINENSVCRTDVMPKVIITGNFMGILS